jgi:hypothetical protein
MMMASKAWATLISRPHFTLLSLELCKTHEVERKKFMTCLDVKNQRKCCTCIISSVRYGENQKTGKTCRMMTKALVELH